MDEWHYERWMNTQHGGWSPPPPTPVFLQFPGQAKQPMHHVTPSDPRDLALALTQANPKDTTLVNIVRHDLRIGFKRGRCRRPFSSMYFLFLDIYLHYQTLPKLCYHPAWPSYLNHCVHNIRKKKKPQFFFFSPSPSSLPPTRRTATTIRIFRHRIVQVPQPRFVWRDNTEKRYKKYRSENPGLRQPCRALFTLLQDMRWAIQTVFFMLSVFPFMSRWVPGCTYCYAYMCTHLYTQHSLIYGTHTYI